MPDTSTSTKTYGALNPEQLANLFTMRAAIALRRSLIAETKTLEREFEIERSTWAEAAEIIRNTEFVGWDAASRIVEEIP